MAITITENAAKEIQNIMTQQGESAKKNGDEAAKLFLRLGVKGGGGSGFSYSLDLTETNTDEAESWVRPGTERTAAPPDV